MEYADFITHCLEEASGVARTSFGKVSGTVKEDDNNQVFTETDLEIGRLLIDRIRTKFPDHNIIDEEAGVIDNGSNFTWVIDPIDGTSNFASGVPLYGLALGLLRDGVPVAGGFALPSFSEIYVAEKGLGAFCNSERIHVTKEIELKNILVAYGIDGHRDNPDFTREECMVLADLALHCRNLRSSNSVFDTAMVARGNYGAFLNRTSKIWDNVAQQIVIEEAGGMYTDYQGNTMNYSNAIIDPEANYTCLASSSTLHERLLEIIRKK